MADGTTRTKRYPRVTRKLVTIAKSLQSKRLFDLADEFAEVENKVQALDTFLESVSPNGTQAK